MSSFNHSLSAKRLSSLSLGDFSLEVFADLFALYLLISLQPSLDLKLIPPSLPQSQAYHSCLVILSRFTCHFNISLSLLDTIISCHISSARCRLKMPLKCITPRREVTNKRHDMTITVARSLVSCARPVIM